VLNTNNEVLRFILQIFALIVGGGTVQLLVFLLKRRSELRSLDTASDATALNSANAYVVTLQAGEQKLREHLAVLEVRIGNMQRTWDIERRAHTEALNNAHRELSRVTAEAARMKTDLAVAQAQITKMSARHEWRGEL
jgi:hypothetical protein